MSTLSVNNITTQTGSTITIPSGKTLIAPSYPIQTVTSVDNTGANVASSNTTKFMDVAFTTKVANSTMIVRFYTAIYRTNTATGNRDIDVCLGLGFKTGSATSSASDYTAITTYAPSREFIAFANGNRAFYSSDAFYAGGTYSGRYHPIDTIYNEESFSPSLAAGTTIRIACFFKQDYAQSTPIRIGRQVSGMSDGGSTSCLNITEVAPS